MLSERMSISVTCVDWSRLGLAGHSLGGYTVLGLCGAWPSWKLSGVKAVLALSPYSQPFILHKTLADLSVPVMYQGGTWDYGATPGMEKSGLSYEQSPAPKYYVEFKQAGHLPGPTLARASFRREIIAYSLAFMNHYVKGEPAERLLTQASPAVAQVQLSRQRKKRQSRQSRQALIKTISACLSRNSRKPPHFCPVIRSFPRRSS